MAVELAVGYVSLVPSARGIHKAIDRDLRGPTKRAAADAGEEAGRSFGRNFQDGVRKAGTGNLGKRLAKSLGDQISISGKPLAIVAGTALSTHIIGSLASGLASGAVNLAHGFGAAIALLPAAALAGGLALGALTVGLLGVGDALKAGLAGDTEAYNEALKGLAPAAAAATRELVGLKPQLDFVKNAVQGQLFGPLVGEIRPLADIYLPLVGHHLGVVAAGMGEAAAQVSGFLQVPGVAERLGESMGFASESVNDIVGALAVLPRALLPLVTVGSTFLPQLTGGLEGAATKLALFMENAERTGQLAAFIQGGIDSIRQLVDTAKQLIRIGRNVGDVLGAMFSSVSAPAGTLLDSLEKVTAKAAEFAETAKGSELFGQIMATVGAILANVFGTLQRVATALANIFGPIMPQILEFIEALSKVKAALLDTALDALEPILSGIADVLGDVVLPALTKLGDFLADNRAVVQGIGIAIMAFLVPSFVAWAIAAGVAAVATIAAWAPIILIGAAIAGLAALVIIHFDTIKRWISNAFNWVKDNWPLLLGILTGPIGLAVVLITRNWETITRLFKTGVDFVVRIWKVAWTAVVDFLRAAWQTISTFFRELPGKFRAFFSNAVEWLVEAGKNILRGAFNGIKAIWTGLATWFSDRKQAIRDRLTGAIDWLLLTGKNIIRGLWKGIRQVWSDVLDWFKDLPGKVLDALGIASPPQWAVDAGKWILKGITKGLGLGVGSVMDFMGGIAGKFTGPLKNAWDGLFDFFTGAGGGSGKLVGAAASAYNLFKSLFPLMTIGGWRSTGSVPGSDHPKGKALDLMTTSSAVADQIIRTFRGLAGAKYWIWNRQIATAAGGWNPRPYRGPSPHTDHVHLSFLERGAWRTRAGLAMIHDDEMMLPRNIANAVRSTLLGGPDAGGAPLIGTLVIQASSVAEGRAAGKAFLDVLDQRRVLTDARIA